MTEAMKITRDEERRLLARWSDTTEFDETPDEAVPELEPEDDDETDD